MSDSEKPQEAFDRTPFSLGRKTVRGRLVLPSGIRCVHGSTIQKSFIELPSVGVVTTKSLSYEPRMGYHEPIFARFGMGSYVNAVGLANPGAEIFLSELTHVQIPEDKFLLVSIFGADVEEFCRTADALSSVADGFELNMSCPHAAGYGLQIGQDLELLTAITRAVCQRVNVPVLVKLSAILPLIKEKATAAISAGAIGITVSNSVGPALVNIGSSSILHNGIGGLSGNAVRPLCLFAIRAVREALGPEPLIVAMGGIGTAEHIRQFRNAGADLFGIGSALTGLDSDEVVSFFSELDSSLDDSESGLVTESRDTSAPMEYHKCLITDRRWLNEDIFEISVNGLPGAPKQGEASGQYYFLCLPDVGEKPFYVASSTNRTFLIQKVGRFTQALSDISVGREILVRGPYGKTFAGLSGCSNYLLVGEGVAAAALIEVGYKLRDHARLQFILAAGSSDEIPYLDHFRELGEVLVVVDKCGEIYSTAVSAALRERLANMPPTLRGVTGIVNRGSNSTVKNNIAIEKEFVSLDRIYSGTSFYTSCGVGICGKCASPSGNLSCVDGPFLSAHHLYMGA